MCVTTGDASVYCTIMQLVRLAHNVSRLGSYSLNKLVWCSCVLQLHQWQRVAVQIMTFKPAISKRAHELPSRSFEELSEGDRLRRDCYLVRLLIPLGLHCML